MTADIVRSLGVVAVDGETDPRRLARRLRGVSDAAFDALADLFDEAHYGPRLETVRPCPTCGASLWSLAPAERELMRPGAVAGTDGAGTTSSDAVDPGTAGGDFPDLDAFDELVTRVARRVLTREHLRDVELVVEGGPAATDAGGTPLLGSYLPPDPDGPIPTPAQIALYHRTFQNQWREDGPYDLAAEVEETLRHELEHHVAHLSGDDPMDREERAEIVRDEVRRLGPTEAARREVREGVRGLREFFRATWWIWLLALAGAAASLSR